VPEQALSEPAGSADAYRGRLGPEQLAGKVPIGVMCSDGDVCLPFCGDEYPPLKASPGAVICTKPCHPETEMHLNEETGWVWRTSA